MRFKNDLLMRTIEQFAQTLIAILRFKQGGHFDEALAQINEAYRQHTGSDSSLIHRLPTEQLLALLKTSGRLDAQRCLFLAELLRVEAEVREARGEQGLTPILDKALDLHLEVLQAEPVLLEPYGEKVEQLLGKLHALGVQLSPITERRLFEYHVLRGAYAQAEDTLFRLLEQHPEPELVARGRHFYSELQALPDEALVAGNLPREEITEGLKALDSYTI